jgi:16S rRNA (cytosine967-C5)-methyltransferase
VYGTLRNEVLLDACLALRLAAPERLPAEVHDALRLGAYELLIRGTPAHAAVDQWVSVVKSRSPKLSGLANAVLRRVRMIDDLPWNVRRSLPEWLALRFESLLGEAADDAAAGMLEPEPLWLSALHDGAGESLEREGCEVREGPVTGSLAVRSPRPLGELEAFRSGLVQPQNPASRLPVAVLDAGAGDRVLDLASGNGIKSAQLAAMGARVTAVEIDGAKIRRSRSNLARLGLAVEHVEADLRSAPDLPPASFVLLDAPCSGTGTLRGNPEIKLRLDRDGVAELARLQQSMLESAAALTSPGGHLVYSVCALTPEEGPEQVRSFLERHPDFEARPSRLPVDSRPAGAGAVVLPVGGLDGFFIALLRRSTSGGVGSDSGAEPGGGVAE